MKPNLSAVAWCCSVAMILVLTSCVPADKPPSAAEETEASSVEPEYTLGSENTHNRWSSAIPPVLTVPSGAIVEIETKEATDGQLTLESTSESMASLDFNPIHPLTGPIYVEGAEAGDVLAVTFHEIEVLNWGWTGIVPGFGFLADEFTDPYLKTVTVEEGQTHIQFSENISIPIVPFPGVIGVAPASEEQLVTIPPRENGGNMDNRYLGVGTTVYLPVYVDGALLSLGDTHAAQGDGEVGGTGLEAPMRIVLEVEVKKGGRVLPEPEYETDDYYAVTAFAESIDGAARKATLFMIDYLVAERGLTRQEAYVLCSLAGDLKISEAVDMPHYLVSMHMPKEIFN